MVHERCAVGEAHQARTFDHPCDLEPMALEELADVRYCGAMLDVRAKLFGRLAKTAKRVGEDIVELVHVSLEVRSQREHTAITQHAPAFSRDSCPIVEVVDAEVGDDQIESAICKWHRRRTSLVQCHIR